MCGPRHVLHAYGTLPEYMHHDCCGGMSACALQDVPEDEEASTAAGESGGVNVTAFVRADGKRQPKLSKKAQEALVVH